MFAGLRVDVLLVLDTHIQFTKSFDCHEVPLSDFGGHSVIRIFGYQDDDMIMT
jgi:hypothetical protein